MVIHHRGEIMDNPFIKAAKKANKGNQTIPSINGKPAPQTSGPRGANSNLVSNPPKRSAGRGR